jgi:hypothetical protein
MLFSGTLITEKGFQLERDFRKKIKIFVKILKPMEIVFCFPIMRTKECYSLRKKCIAKINWNVRV